MAKIDVNTFVTYLIKNYSGSEIEHLLDKIKNSVQFSQDEKDKLESIAENANAYKHPTGDGYFHVPANGKDNGGKVLFSGTAEGDYFWKNIGIDNILNLRERILKIDSIPFEVIKTEVSPGDSKMYWITKDGTNSEGELCIYPVSQFGVYEVTGYESFDMPIGVFKDFEDNIVGYVHEDGSEDYTIGTYVVSAPEGAETLWVNQTPDRYTGVYDLSYKFNIEAGSGSVIVDSTTNGNIIVDNEEIVVYEHPDGNHVTDKEKSVLENIDTYIKTVVSDLMEDYEIVENDLSSLYPIYYASITTSPTSASDITKSFTQTNIRKFTIPAGQYCIACEQEFSRIRDTNFFDNTETFEKTKVDDLYVYTYKNTTLIPMEFTVYF